MILSKHRQDGWRHLQLMQRAMLACHVRLCWWRGTSRTGASGGWQLLHGLKRWHEVTGHANWLSPSYAAVSLHHLRVCSLPCNCCHFGSNRVLCLTMQTVSNNCRSISCGRCQAHMGLPWRSSDLPCCMGTYQHSSPFVKTDTSPCRQLGSLSSGLRLTLPRLDVAPVLPGNAQLELVSLHLLLLVILQAIRHLIWELQSQMLPPEAAACLLWSPSCSAGCRKVNGIAVDGAVQTCQPRPSAPGGLEVSSPMLLAVRVSARACPQLLSGDLRFCSFPGARFSSWRSH